MDMALKMVSSELWLLGTPITSGWSQQLFAPQGFPLTRLNHLSCLHVLKSLLHSFVICHFQLNDSWPVHDFMTQPGNACLATGSQFNAFIRPYFSSIKLKTSDLQPLHSSVGLPVVCFHIGGKNKEGSCKYQQEPWSVYVSAVWFR